VIVDSPLITKSRSCRHSERSELAHKRIAAMKLAFVYIVKPGSTI
jgi:hypothetical protein